MRFLKTFKDSDLLVSSVGFSHKVGPRNLINHGMNILSTVLDDQSNWRWLEAVEIMELVFIVPIGF